MSDDDKPKVSTSDGRDVTLGGHKGGGFQKPRVTDASRISVDPGEISTMQRGYETRIARQSEALGRMSSLLSQRTDDVLEHMRRADELAAVVAEGGLGVLAPETDDVLASLARLVPAQWGDAVAGQEADFLSRYIEYCNIHLANIREVIKPEMAKRGLSGNAGLADAIDKILNQMTRELNQARQDASRNADVANQALKARSSDNVIQVDDQNPPWATSNEGVSFTAPVDLDRSAGIPVPVAIGEDRETLAWDGAAQLGDGDRPGNSF